MFFFSVENLWNFTLNKHKYIEICEKKDFQWLDYDILR